MSSNTEPRRWTAWCCAGCAKCLDGPPQTPCDSDSEDGRVVVEASAYDALAAELDETLDTLGAARMIRDYLAAENASLREALEAAGVDIPGETRDTDACATPIPHLGCDCTTCKEAKR